MAATSFIPLHAQQPDARFWYDDINYCCGNGYVDLYLGGPAQVVKADDDHAPCVSFQVFSPNVAIKITVLDQVLGRSGPYELFIYSEVSQPKYFGTNQYCGKSLKVECMPASLPQPRLFIPVDRTSVHPAAIHSPLWPWKPGHKMLVLRKAYFWENSEDLGGLHGPYGDMNVSACSPELGAWRYEDFINHWEQNVNSPLRMHWMTLPGPIWSGYAPLLFPKPYSEWIDGPWGCVYSNIAVHDWGANPSTSDAITVVITESDKFDDEDVLGWLRVTSEMPGPIVLKARMFGWVVLENIVVAASGSEPSVEVGNVYWHGGWDGVYPEEVYSPQDDPVVPCKTCPGSQYRPFTDAQIENFLTDARFEGYTVGLLGNNFPAEILNKNSFAPNRFVQIQNPSQGGRKP